VARIVLPFARVAAQMHQRQLYQCILFFHPDKSSGQFERNFIFSYMSFDFGLLGHASHQSMIDDVSDVAKSEL